MALVDLLYPPRPVGIPPDLTSPSKGYRWKVLVVLGSLFLFLALYLGMITGAAYLLLISLPYPISQDDRGVFIWKVMALFGTSFLLFVLLRGLFRTSQTYHELLVEINETDQPTVFAFLQRLCEELEAPFPHRVFLSPEVNAAVFGRTSILSLFLPARRDLVIGLGLVNALNLTEMKAVLAHELGHFSQKSTRLTRYIYTVNPIMADIVYRRDRLDHLVAWALNGVVTVAQQDVRAGAWWTRQPARSTNRY
jgi:Zn-dependent protease with chaperone function